MSLIEALLISLLLGLGTARAAAIIAIDEISAPLRDFIFHWYPPENNDERGFYYQDMRKATRQERDMMTGWDIPWWQKLWSPAEEGEDRDPSFLGKLLQCHKCVAVWVAAGNVALFFIWRDVSIVLNVFLAAALVSAVVNRHLYD